MLKRTLSLLLCLYSLFVYGQDWNQKKAAVVLTYDDALHVHLDHVVPALDSLDLKGTFYLTAAAPAFTQRMEEWKKVATNGHELANHTLFHPCHGSLPGRDFVSPEYDLATYSPRRITEEIKMTNTVLEAIDGKRERTFAYPCGDTRVGEVLYMESLYDDFVAARGVQGEMLRKGAGMDIYNVGSFMMSGQSGEEMIALVKKAIVEKSLLVFLFHGVGGEHGLNVSQEAHRQLLHFLKEHENEVWTTTFLEAAVYMKN
jgi:peptidoglycan/xylan/chitin deacetylase (PgdA/CDA1 family)